MSVPAAKAALIEAIRAQPVIVAGDVLVGWGLPPTLPRQRERVFVLGAEDYVRAQPYESGPESESFVLPVLVEAHHATQGTARETETRAWGLLDAVRLAVGALNSVEWDAALSRAEEGESGPTDQGWLSQIVARASFTTIST